MPARASLPRQLLPRVDVDRVAEMTRLEPAYPLPGEQVTEADVAAELARAREQPPPDEDGMSRRAAVGGTDRIVVVLVVVECRGDDLRRDPGLIAERDHGGVHIAERLDTAEKRCELPALPGVADDHRGVVEL